MGKAEKAGQNFQVAKLLAVLTVATAHFFPDTALWVASTMSLFVFGFASGYFTHLKYGASLELRPYMLNKVSRLAIPLFVINCFLLIFLSLTSNRSVWSWHTSIHLVGLSGFLDWLGIQNESPLGNGLWFLTVLFVFYALYPGLRGVSARRGWRFLVGGLALLVVYLQTHVPVGYDLWLTTFSFVYGVYLAGFQPTRTGNLYAVGCLGSILGMAVSKYGLHNTTYSFFFILVASVCLVRWLLVATLPAWVHRTARYGSDLLLEIYLIHTYLFVAFLRWQPLDYILSLLLILAVARALKTMVAYVEQLSDTLLISRRPSQATKTL